MGSGPEQMKIEEKNLSQRLNAKFVSSSQCHRSVCVCVRVFVLWYNCGCVLKYNFEVLKYSYFYPLFQRIEIYWQLFVVILLINVLHAKHMIILKKCNALQQQEALG